MIFSAIGAAIFGAGSFLAGATAFGLQIAAGIGVSLLAKAIAGKQDAPAATQSTGGIQGALASGADVPRSFMLGYSATQGSLVYANHWGNDGETPNAYVTQVIAISDLPVRDLVELWVNGASCSIGATADPVLGYPVPEYNKDGKDHLWIRFYDGTQTAADPLCTSRVASAARPYGATRVGKGIAYAVMTSMVEDTLFTGFPKFVFGVQGIPLYDPSKDDTTGGSGAQRWSDRSTWGGDGDNLPAVQIYNLQRGITYDGGWLYGLQNMTANRLPTANWIAQIAKCRATIAGASGPEPTYRSGLQVNVSTQLATTVESLLSACHGRISEIGGFYKIHLGAPDSPTFWFTDDDILSSEAQSFSPFFGLADTVNGITARYPSPATGWATQSAPPLYSSAFEAQDGGRRLLSDVALDAAPYDEQVQRLMSSALEEARRARRHTFVMPPEFWVVEPGDTGSWTSTRNGYVDKLFRVDGMTDKANLDTILDLTEIDPADYDWHTGTDYVPPTNGPTVITRPTPQPIVDWFAQATIIKDANGVDRRPAILLSWAGNMPDVSGVQFEVRITSDDTVIYRGRTDNVAAGSIVISQNLLPNQHYQVRGRYIPAWPRDTLWSDWLDVTTPNVLFSILDFEQGVADQVTNQFKETTDRLNKIVQQVASVAAELDATHMLENTKMKSSLVMVRDNLSAAITQVQEVAAGTDAALASFQTTVAAQFNDQSANIEQNSHAIAGTNSALASFESSVNASIGSQSASISQNAQAVAAINGHLAASYGVTMNVAGYASGFTLLSDGSASGFVIEADTFQVAAAGHAGGAPVSMFQIANFGGVPKIVFRGDMVGDGSITVNMMSVAELTAISTHLGNARVDGSITGTSGGMQHDFTNDRIVIYGT